MSAPRKNTDWLELLPIGFGKATVSSGLVVHFIWRGD
jgi:hypothetical protein